MIDYDLLAVGEAMTLGGGMPRRCARRGLDLPGHAGTVPAGSVRRHRRRHPAAHGDTIDLVAAYARELAGEGYTAVKVGPPGRLAYLETPAGIQDLVDQVTAVREAIGPHHDLAIDLHGRASVPLSRGLLPLLEPFRPMFVEEPLRPEFSSQIGRIVGATTVPVATGERLYSRTDFMPVLQAGVAVVQPDPCHAGCISSPPAPPSTRRQAPVPNPSISTRPWWRSAAIYQVYPRSFADGNGDGVGDLPGIRQRLGYLRDLGVDGIWLSPWYVSPMADAGYDIADYRDIDPIFGTLADAEALISEAHDHGLRIVIDIVPNHCSDQHPWFVEALAAGPGSPQRARFWFRPGRGDNGELPPNDWPANFGGPAWTRVTEPDGTPGEWYLHLFTPEQPDFNWTNPDVQAEFDDILRFWLDRGVDGFRIDVAHGLMKADGLPDKAVMNDPLDPPQEDRPEVHDIYRRWRGLIETYPGERIFVGEIWVPTPEKLARYLRSDELHNAFNFDFLRSGWNATQMRTTIDDTIAAHTPVGAPPTWVLTNHDVTRHVTRYGRTDTTYLWGERRHGWAVDLDLGSRRARAAALLTMALPGGIYIYQGDELGLWEVEDLPDHVLQDPIWHRSGHTDRGRDGCRVPLPWSGLNPPFGFSPDDANAEPWLPQPAEWKEYTAGAQTSDPTSMLALYRRALAVRRAEPALGDGTMTWQTSQDGVLSFHREPGFTCVVNFTDHPIELPPHQSVLLASVNLSDGQLPAEAAVWLRAAGTTS